MASPPDDEQPPEAPPRSRSSWAWTGIFVGGTLAVGVALFLTLLNPALPLLTRDVWREAFKKWRASDPATKEGPANYDIEIHVVGAQDSLYHVEVRNHKVIAATRNDDPLHDERTWQTWSVPGMFETMELDLEALDADNAAERINLVLRARFDPDTGVPLEYQRHQLDPPFDAHWKVVLFEPLP